MASRIRKTVSIEKELEVLLKAYNVNKGYISVNPGEEEKVGMALDRLIDKGFIREEDKPLIYYGEGLGYYVNISDKGKKVVRKTISDYKRL